MRRLLVLGRDCDAIAALVRAGAPEVEVTARSFDAATQGDLERAEMLLAFRIPPRIAAGARSLKWVQSTGAGVDGLLAWGEIPDKTPLTRVLGVFSEPMSEYVLSRLLMIAQDVPRQMQAQRERRWEPSYPRLFSELSVVVLGLGEIGATIARKLKANGARVAGVSRGGEPVAGIDEVLPASRLRDALPRADALVIVVPRTPATESLIGTAEIGALKPGAWIVNVARGSCVDEGALIGALESGRLGGAALDVFREEPLPDSSPLWRLPNVIVSPHVAGLTTPSQAANAFLDNWKRLARGEPLQGVVDRDRGY